MGIRKTFAEVRSWNSAQWRLVAEAGLCLFVARLAVWVVPFRRLAARVGDVMAESPEQCNEAQRTLAAQVGWAIRGLGRSIPGMRQCLVQSLAATWMLRRRAIPSTLYFGLAKDDAGELLAHAWVRSGELVLTGAEGRNDYTVVATFAVAHLSKNRDLAAH